MRLGQGRQLREYKTIYTFSYDIYPAICTAIRSVGNGDATSAGANELGYGTTAGFSEGRGGSEQKPSAVRKRTKITVTACKGQAELTDKQRKA